jgi:hypothetical protein
MIVKGIYKGRQEEYGEVEEITVGDFENLEVSSIRMTRKETFRKAKFKYKHRYDLRRWQYLKLGDYNCCR